MTFRHKNADVRFTIGAALLTLLILLAFAPAARATYDTVGSGSTVIHMNRSFLTALKTNKVKYRAVKPARLKGSTLTVPVANGKIDPTNSRGTLKETGGIVFQLGSQTLSLKSLILKTTQKHSPFSAKVGGGQLKLGTTSKLKTARNGFGFEIRVGKLTLSEKVAQRLEKRLHIRGAFSSRTTLGSFVTRTRPATTAILAANDIDFQPDPQTFAKLAAHFVATNPIAPAEHSGTGFNFPIAGGRIAPDGSAGEVQGSGSLEMIQLPGGGQIFLREIGFDLTAQTISADVEIQPSPPFGGKLGRVEIAAVDLAGATIGSNPATRTVSVANATSTLTPALATALNEVFVGKEQEFKPGDPLGSFAFTAQGQ